MAKGKIHSWKAKYGSIEVAEAARLLELKARKMKLKKLVAESMLEKVTVRDAFG